MRFPPQSDEFFFLVFSCVLVDSLLDLIAFLGNIGNESAACNWINNRSSSSPFPFQSKERLRENDAAEVHCLPYPTSRKCPDFNLWRRYFRNRTSTPRRKFHGSTPRSSTASSSSPGRTSKFWWWYFVQLGPLCVTIRQTTCSTRNISKYSTSIINYYCSSRHLSSRTRTGRVQHQYPSIWPRAQVEAGYYPCPKFKSVFATRHQLCRSTSTKTYNSAGSHAGAHWSRATRESSINLA